MGRQSGGICCSCGLASSSALASAACAHPQAACGARLVAEVPFWTKTAQTWEMPVASPRGICFSHSAPHRCDLASFVLLLQPSRGSCFAPVVKAPCPPRTHVLADFGYVAIAVWARSVVQCCGLNHTNHGCVRQCASAPQRLTKV